MRECIRKHLEMFLLHHVHSMCIMLGFGREGERRSCLVAAENFFFFLSSTLRLESENIFKWVLTNIWSCFHKKWEELWDVILKVEIYIFFSCRIICLASFDQWPHLRGGREVWGVADLCCLFTTNLSVYAWWKLLKFCFMELLREDILPLCQRT